MNSCGSSSANCPSTAEAVYIFLNTGRLRPAVCAGPRQGFEVHGTYQQGPFQQLVTRVRGGTNGNHCVVEATRATSHRLGPMHSFNLVKIGTDVYVADAQTVELTNDVNAYFRSNAFQASVRFCFTGYRTRLVTV
jgi:hypothetical protein